MNLHDVLKKVESLKVFRDHIKSQLLFHGMETGEVKMVHFQRLIPIMNRLLDLEKFQEVIHLLNKDSNETYAKQLLTLFSDLGEFAKLPGGYFLPLPERAVELPRSKKLIYISSRVEKASSLPYLGLCSGYCSVKGNVPTMTLDDWMPSINVKEFLQIINKSQSYEITDKPEQVFIPKDYRGWDKYEKVKDRNIKEFIAKFYAEKGPASYFWARRIKSKTYYYQIPSHYLEIAKFALEKQAGISRNVECLEIDGNLFKVKFNQRIPIEEKKMLMLFAYPENLYNPFRWIAPVSHYEDFIEVVEKIGIEVPRLFNSRH